MVRTTVDDLITYPHRERIANALTQALKEYLDAGQYGEALRAFEAAYGWTNLRAGEQELQAEALRTQLGIESMQLARLHLMREAWRHYAACALANGAGPEGAAKTADKMLIEERERFGPLPQ
jgi:hypothetical protein